MANIDIKAHIQISYAIENFLFFFYFKIKLLNCDTIFEWQTLQFCMRLKLLPKIYLTFFYERLEFANSPV